MAQFGDADITFYFIIGKDGLSAAILDVLKSQSFIKFMERRDFCYEILMSDSEEAVDFFEIFNHGCAPILYAVTNEGIPQNIVDLKSRFPSTMRDKRTLLSTITAIVRNSAGRSDDDGEANTAGLEFNADSSFYENLDLCELDQSLPTNEHNVLNSQLLPTLPVDHPASLYNQEEFSDNENVPVRERSVHRFGSSNIKIIIPGDDQTLVAQFTITDTLQSIHDRVVSIRGLSNFKLLKGYPRRPFTTEEYGHDLASLGLVPEGVVYVSFMQLNQTSGTIMQRMSTLLWFVTAPFARMLDVVVTFFSSFFQRPAVLAPQNAGPARRRRRNSNVHTLHDLHDRNDDENNTYNGNSTQQK